MSNDRHQVTRVRREPRRRTIRLVRRELLGPRLLRLEFEAEALRDFESAAPDDHIKLFVPNAAGDLIWRDYTPRRLDNARGALTIDFALHEAGPATAWARAAQLGETVEIGGPRGSAVVPDDFDWYLLIGDETALPAIARRLEELRADVPVTVVAVIDGPADRLTFAGAAQLTVIWVERRTRPGTSDGALIQAAIDPLPTPHGEGYAWVAAEASVAQEVRRYLIEKRGHPRRWMRAAGYWRVGSAGSHTTFKD